MRLALRMVVSAPMNALHGVYCILMSMCPLVIVLCPLIIGAVSKIADENVTASCYVPNSDLSSTEPYTSILSLVSHANTFSDVQQKTMFEKV